MAENQSSTANMSKKTASTQPLPKKSSERAGYREVEREMEAALAEAHAAGDGAERGGPPPNEPITPPPPAQPSSSQTATSEGAAHGGDGEEGGDRAALGEGGEEGVDRAALREGGEEGGDGVGGWEEGVDDEAWPLQSLTATAEENSGVWVTQSFKLQSTK